MPIESVEDLQAHLQLAIEVELTTIPPYLFAMYSIDDQDCDGRQLIRSIAAEEMLHATLIANVLLAIGGEPRFYHPDVIPSFPKPLPHHQPELMLALEPYSRDLVERSFMTIEQPGRRGAPAQPDQWESQGQFYHALEQAILALGADPALFADPQCHRQFHDPHGYAAVRFDSAASGGLVLVDSLESAIQALEIPIHQGEGVSDDRYADPGHSELTHYAKFLLLHDGTIPVGRVRPTGTNPTLATLPPDVQPVAEFSNAAYSFLFVLMDRLFAPDTEERHHLVGRAYGAMMAMLAPVAEYLMSMPIDETRFAGPPFEHYQFDDVRNAERELHAMAARLVPDHPSLEATLRHLDGILNALT